MIKKTFNWKRIMVFLLAVVLVCGLIPGNLSEVKAAESVNGSTDKLNMDNLTYSFQSLDGTTISSQASGKPKMLIFFKTTCYNSQQTISRLCQIEDYGDIDIVAVEAYGSSKADVSSFKDTYGNGRDYIDFCYSTSSYSTYMWRYVYAAGFNSDSITFPVVVYIDANNKVQQVTYSINTAQEIIDNLNTYCNAGLNIYMSPEIYKIVNVVSGVHVYWRATETADAYYVMRRAAGSDGYYSWLTTTTNAHYIDTTAVSGNAYEYLIYSLRYEGDSTYIDGLSETVTTTFVATPDITLRVNRAVGVGLGWDKIEGATGYAIYRKPYYGNEAWVRVKTITDPDITTWDDTSVKTANGTVYRYTIRALAGENRNILSGCRNTGRTMVRLTSRTLNSAVKASATSIKCSWSTTTQATGYEVRFMVGSTVYKTYTIGNYKTGVKTFTGLKAGQTYKIQVRSYKKVDGVGSFYSAWSTAQYVSL